MTLRWRWALTLGSATAVIALLVLLASAVLTARELRTQVDDDLEQRLALTAEGGFPRPVAPFEPRGRRRAPVNLDALYRVVGPAGGVIVDTTDGGLPLDDDVLDLATRTTSDSVLATVEIDDEPYRMIVGGLTDRRGNVNLGAVQIAVGIQDIESSIAALIGRSVAIGAGLILAAAGAGWLLAGRAIGPLTALTEEAERIAATEDLTASVPADRPDEVGRLASAFSSMVRSLSESREQQRRLVTDAGHEFRTPLTALRTNLETLQRRRNDLTDEQMDELVQAALGESIELTNLATELVDLSADATTTGEEIERVDLGEIAATVVARFASRTSDRIDLDGQAGQVDVRVSQIDRVISNLLANAIAWNEPGEPISVTVNGTRCVVRDRGPGIPDTDLPLIFDRFHRGVTARSKPGSGLGLSIVRHIVEGHGGQVFARNAGGGGAEVGFALPDSTRKTGGP